MSLFLHTAPTSEPVQLATAKAHMRVVTDADDPYITSLIKAARMRAEAYTGRAFVTQTWQLFLDCWACPIPLPKGRAQSVTHVKYLNTAGVVSTLSPSDYVVDLKSEPARITPGYSKTWPSIRHQINAIEVQWVAGFGMAEKVPEDIQHAILLIVGHLYEHREEVSDFQVFEVPRAADLLLNHWRLFGF